MCLASSTLPECCITISQREKQLPACGSVVLFLSRNLDTHICHRHLALPMLDKKGRRRKETDRGGLYFTSAHTHETMEKPLKSATILTS